MGGGISFDDSGTGYASISALKDYPVTCLKIDRSFVAEIATNEQDSSIVDALLALSRTFRLDTVAEGIETHVQSRLLRERLCDSGQGYLFGKPMPAEAFGARWLSALGDGERPGSASQESP